MVMEPVSRESQAGEVAPEVKAGMAELADAADSKSADGKSWGFDPPSRHHNNSRINPLK